MMGTCLQRQNKGRTDRAPCGSWGLLEQHIEECTMYNSEQEHPSELEHQHRVSGGVVHSFLTSAGASLRPVDPCVHGRRDGARRKASPVRSWSRRCAQRLAE